MEEQVVKNNNENLETLEEKVIETANKTLKCKYRKRKEKHSEGEEPVWMTEEIREGIKERRRRNRNRRNAQSREEEMKWKDLHLQQKIKVQVQMREEIFKHEEKIAQRIKETKDGRGKMWEYIRMLKGEKVKEKNTLTVYGEDGVELEKVKVEEKIKNFWNGIYRKHKNEIDSVWNSGTREEYIKEYKKIQQEIKEKKSIKLGKVEGPDEDYIETCGIEIREHMEMARSVETGWMHLEEEHINEESIKKSLKRMKNKKAPGTDKIKPEFFKEFYKSEILMEVFKEGMKEVMETGNVPRGWKESRTVMIPKVKKPKASDLRPIALLNVGYKIMMAVVRDSLEQHIISNNIGKDSQAGFTAKSRIENNIFVLRYCIERSFKLKKPLIVIAIDFAKAYDSIKREKLIETLMYYKVDPKIINMIAQVYTDDRTRIELGIGEEVEIEITSGIRQGCTISTTLFKLVTFRIIEELERLGKGFKDEKFRIDSLFFADDGMLLTNSVEDAEEVIIRMEEVGRSFGLEINKGKSNIIIFNLKEKPGEIGNILVKEEITYLGIIINDRRNCFQVHKRKMIEKARKLANLTYSIIGRSCARLLIGKTYWKNVALPSIMYGTNIINLTKQEIAKLQSIENGVYRQIFGAGNYTQGAALVGELGASSVKTRVREGQLKYIRYVLEEGNGLVRSIGEEIIVRRQQKWVYAILNEARKEGVIENGVKGETKESIRRKMRELDTREWKREMDGKTSLTIYRKWRQEKGGQEEIYSNDYGSQLLFKCRTNNLQLNDRKRFRGEETTCDVCGAEREDLNHFLLWCAGYCEERRKSVKSQQPYVREEEEIA